MSRKFPEAQAGGSLVVSWQVRNKNVLVVGSGEVRSFISMSNNHGDIDSEVI
jgi:hypothetical protein